MHILLIGCGPHAKSKYIPLIEQAIDAQIIEGYSILELDNWDEGNFFSSRLIKPKYQYLLPDKRPQKIWFSEEDFAPIIKKLRQEYNTLKLIISTEPKSHFGYLTFAIKNQIDLLIDKPISLPISQDSPYGVDYLKIITEFEELNDLCQRFPGHYSVMMPRRYHAIYLDKIYNQISSFIDNHKVPISSINISHDAGVWNLLEEVKTREDHPYKYGYGMLMHSGYHYIDLLSQLLKLNKMLFGGKFVIGLSTFARHPKDYNLQTTPNMLKKLESSCIKKDDNDNNSLNNFGETDIVVSFSLAKKETNEVLTLGSLSLYQTSPSLRNWYNLPNIYNKNGRYSSESLDVNLSFLFGLNARINKVPISPKSPTLSHSFKHIANIITRKNGNYLGNNEFFTCENIESQPDQVSFLSNSRKELFFAWIKGKDTKSHLTKHRHSVKLLSYITESLSQPGKYLLKEF
jgi:hypothetical protein